MTEKKAGRRGTRRGKNNGSGLRGGASTERACSVDPEKRRTSGHSRSDSRDRSPSPRSARSSCVAEPPEGFQSLADIEGIRLDIRYATSDNFTGAVLPGYGPQSAWLRKEAARALARVQRDLEKQGLGLIVFDGYRPIRASKAMVRWAKRVGRDDLLRASYISRRSKHNLGIAVDVALYDRKTGKALAMGTDFDEFSPKSHTKNATGRVLRNRLILRRAMRARGFLGCRIEWWHFHWPVPKARPMDVTYTCE